jgi:hypothetical protein
MRGLDAMKGILFSYVDIETRIPSQPPNPNHLPHC